MEYSFDLTGETALVTGGTRNIGLEIARALRSAGARVCIIGLSNRQALEEALHALDPDGREAMGTLANVAEETAVQEVFDQAEQEFGPVSILVNAAADRPHLPLTDLTLEQWNEVLNVILTGAFLTSREMFRRLPADRSGAIVNIGGLSAHRPAVDRPHVIAAKSGLVGFTRALAEEGRGRIRANSIVPGVIDTERRSEAPSFSGDESGRSSGTCRDVARAVLCFADPGDTYTTGQTLHVNGGRFMP